MAAASRPNVHLGIYNFGHLQFRCTLRNVASFCNCYEPQKQGCRKRREKYIRARRVGSGSKCGRCPFRVSVYAYTYIHIYKCICAYVFPFFLLCVCVCVKFYICCKPMPVAKVICLCHLAKPCTKAEGRRASFASEVSKSRPGRRRLQRP